MATDELEGVTAIGEAGLAEGGEGFQDFLDAGSAGWGEGGGELGWGLKGDGAEDGGESAVVHGFPEGLGHGREVGCVFAETLEQGEPAAPGSRSEPAPHLKGACPRSP